MERLKYIINILTVALMFGAIAIGKDGRLLGTSADELLTPKQVQQEQVVEVESVEFDGTRIINSESLAKDVVGFAGRTPIKLYIKDGVVVKVEALENDETLSFFRKVTKSGLLDRWNGVEIDKAAAVEVDDVTGATYSSRAVTQNVERAIAYATSVEPQGRGLFEGLELKSIIGLLVILSGVVFSLLRVKSKRAEAVQLALNVAVLGFWCGSFLSMAQVVSWMSNGINLASMSLAVVLLLVVIIMPLVGRKATYCHIHCPLGSAQRLISFAPIPKFKIPHKLGKVLNRLRYIILFALLVTMWLGVGFELMDYELFTAFLLGSASNVVLIGAGVFLFLSLFIDRPYCRFICPTGAMITIMQKTKE